jgi:hypothetical protein
MQRGVFDVQDQRYHPMYAFDNPMYSKILVAWRSEHRKWIRNAGAPDHAGIRSESRADSARRPVGFFQVRVQPLEPPVARDAESTRLAILAGVRYMIDHAPAREANPRGRPNRVLKRRDIVPALRSRRKPCLRG